MQSLWIKKALSVFLALLIAVGVCGLLPGGTEAAATQAPLAAGRAVTANEPNEGGGADGAAGAEGGAAGADAGGGAAIKGAPGHTVNITNCKSSYTAEALATGPILDLEVKDGNTANALVDVVSATWTSSRPDIVTVSDTNSGATLGLGSIGMGGPVEIRVEVVINLSGGGTETRTATATIDEVTPVIRFSTASAPMSPGETRTIAVTKYPANASILFESNASTRVSVSPTTATTDAAATITAHTASTQPTTITAYFNGYDRTVVSATYDIPSVKQVPTLQWTQAVISLSAGGTLMLMPYLHYSDGLLDQLTFSSDVSGVGTFAADTAELSTATGDAGVVTISVTSAETDDFLAGGPAKIKVYVGKNYSITVADAIMRVDSGDQGTTTIAKEANAGNWDISSSDTTVATAVPGDTAENNTTLVITGHSAGTATITIRAIGSIAYATVTVTVDAPPEDDFRQLLVQR